jgi:hypothetical protein
MPSEEKERYTALASAQSQWEKSYWEGRQKLQMKMNAKKGE